MSIHCSCFANVKTCTTFSSFFHPTIPGPAIFRPLTTLRQSQNAQDDVTAITGYNYNTACDDVWVAGEFEFSRHRDNSGIPFAVSQKLAPHKIGHREWISWTVQRNILPRRPPSFTDMRGIDHPHKRRLLFFAFPWCGRV